MKILNFDFGATPRYTMRSSMTLKRGDWGELDMMNRIQQQFSKSDNSTSSNQFCAFILFLCFSFFFDFLNFHVRLL